MTKDSYDINIVQQTCCEPPFPDVQMQLKTYFFVPFVRPCMHHNYGVTSRSHACLDCGWFHSGSRNFPRLLILLNSCYTPGSFKQIHILFLLFNKLVKDIQVVYGKLISKPRAELGKIYCIVVVRRVDNHFVPWLKGRFLRGIFHKLASASRILPEYRL